MGQNLIVDMDIKENIKALRKSSGMSQAEVAVKLQTMGIKMSRSWFSAIELGNRNVPVKVLVGLKILFKCEYADFFTGLEDALLESIGWHGKE